MSETLHFLEEVIRERKATRPEGSYTSELLEQGMSRIAQKVGEEGVEVAIASLTEDDDRLLSETADLVYHCLVLLAARDLSWRQVEERLGARFK